MLDAQTHTQAFNPACPKGKGSRIRQQERLPGIRITEKCEELGRLMFRGKGQINLRFGLFFVLLIQIAYYQNK